MRRGNVSLTRRVACDCSIKPSDSCELLSLEQSGFNLHRISASKGRSVVICT